MTASRAAAALCVAVLFAAGCSTGAAEESASAQPSDRDVVAIASPSAPPATPQEAALEAWQSYLAASVDAMAEGKTQSAALAESADGEALRLARRRVRANSRDGVVVTGDLTSSVTPTDVEITAQQTQASITDCVLNNLVHASADDPDEVVREATGWRQPVNARLELRGEQWVVTAAKVPNVNGGGPVEAQAGPALRGPAPRERAPSCVPADEADAVVDAYLVFERAFDEAAGLNGAEEARPWSPALAEAATRKQLRDARRAVRELKRKGRVLVGEADKHNPRAISMTAGDTRAVVLDCVTVGASQVVDAETRDVIAEAPVGKRSLLGAELARETNGPWKVVASTVIEDGVRECKLPE